MSDVLDSAHTWFFESMRHDLDGTLCVRLAEGIKGDVASMVDVGATEIGPFFPVSVQPTSRTVRVRFPLVVAHFVIDESYPPIDRDLVKGAGRFLMTVENSSFSCLMKSQTPFFEICSEPVVEYSLWCEDRIIYVIAHGIPQVTLTDASADLSLERGHTYQRA